MTDLTIDAIAKRLKDAPGVHHAEVTGDGYHFQVTLVSPHFEGLSRIKREQWVYTQLGDWITSGQLHAITMKTWTVAEWEKNHG